MSKSSLFSQFKTDESAEKNGILFEVPGIFRCRLARAGGKNNQYEKKMLEALRPYRNVPAEQIKTGVLESLSIKVMSETLIKPGTWQTFREDQWVDGIENEAGELLPATAENLRKVLLQLPDLSDMILRQARDADNFRAEQLEEEAKNS